LTSVLGRTEALSSILPFERLELYLKRIGP